MFFKCISELTNMVWLNREYFATLEFYILPCSPGTILFFLLLVKLLVQQYPGYEFCWNRTMYFSFVQFMLRSPYFLQFFSLCPAVAEFLQSFLQSLLGLLHEMTSGHLSNDAVFNFFVCLFLFWGVFVFRSCSFQLHYREKINSLVSEYCMC